MICSNCGTHNTEGSNYCNNCGAPLKYIKCERCGFHNKPSAKFCVNCGVPLSTIIRIVNNKN
ncbi:zinc ribbon domain-containing protein [Sulfuracidifex metallicus]|uniref:zinc ribbon domain-containing protein n=1 Tax=Sulfuracidifex metallicus TaxID=47303 RepID=UPI003C6FA7EE